MDYDKEIKRLNDLITELHIYYATKVKESILTKWSDQFPVNKSHGEDITVFEALTRQDKKIAELTMLCERLQRDIQSLMYDAEEDEEDDE